MLECTTILSNIITPFAAILAALAAFIVYFQQRKEILKSNRRIEINELSETCILIYREHLDLIKRMFEIWSSTGVAIPYKKSQILPLAIIANNLLDNLESFARMITELEKNNEVGKIVRFYCDRRHIIVGDRYAFEAKSEIEKQGLQYPTK